MYYEINVSKDGEHLFTTDKRSVEYNWELERVYKIFEQKFPEYEGYKIDVIKWETRGFVVDDVWAHIKEEQNN